ncbi:MAG: hypothetical protein M3Y85_00685 [Bacteroidota bacterium]|nr:hypothetical protein [Bacteroidota bacterium]
MQQFERRPSIRERKEDNNRMQYASSPRHESFREPRLTGEPAKFNTRTENRRIVWENDLYERQSI